MTQCNDIDPRSAYQPGETVLVFVLGAWMPAVVIQAEAAGHVLARYRRQDGELAERAFPRSAVVGADALLTGTADGVVPSAAGPGR